MLLGLDDTDTRHGGCTTHTALRIAATIEHHGGVLDGWGLIAPARLVRLNPAAPHKTRGNGALALPIGPRDPDARLAIGRFQGRMITMGPRATPAAHDPHDHSAAIDALRRIAAEHLPRPGDDDHDPQPGAILAPRAPDPTLYAHAVSRLVRPADAWQHAPPGTLRLTTEPRRGDIGALAATAWPLQRWTWEAIAYRDTCDAAPDRDLPTEFRSAVHSLTGGFDNIDPTTDRLRAVPRTPCPVRWGLRGTDPHALLALHDHLAPDDHWLMQTNHATGDHARHANATPSPHGTVRGTFHVRSAPERHPGGHLFVDAMDADGIPRTLAAYEPTKTLRDALQPARPGDILHLIGRTAGDPTTIAVEAFAYRHAPSRTHKLANPRCPCGRSMKSIGTGAGYRCRPCGTRLDPANAPRVQTPGPATGMLHQVPDHVRGHLLPPTTRLGPVSDLGSSRTCTIAPLEPAMPPAAPPAAVVPHPQTERRSALV